METENKAAWVVHVVGPDDVIAQSDEVTALRYANALNDRMEKERRQFANHDNYPYCIAIARKSDAPEVG